MSEKPKCFVVMPITTPESKLEIYNDDKNYFPKVLENLFAPALTKAGYEIIPPETKGSELIHADIIKNLSTSDLVLCDMSTSNSNVFFEFGIRCALNRPVVLVIDEKTDYIPFDTNIIKYHTYSSLPVWNIDKEIEALLDHITNTNKKTPKGNVLWKYFGVQYTGAYNPESITIDEKLDYIINLLAKNKDEKLDSVISLLTKPGVILDPREQAFEKLTATEKSVLMLISQGKTNREIAAILFLGEGTVRNYVSSILAKLGVSNRAEAAAYAIKNGLKDILV